MLRRRGLVYEDDGYKGLTIEIKMTASNQSFTLPLASIDSPSYNFTVFWGDGSSNTVTAYNSANRVHTYSNAIGDTFIVEILGRCDRLYFEGFTSRSLVYKILSLGGSSFDGFAKNFYGSFLQCNNLIEISGPPIKFRESITDMSYAFYQCGNLATIPKDLFINAASATNYGYMFVDCNKLQMRSDIFNFANFLNKSIDWRGFLVRSSFTGTQGTAPAIWSANYGTGTPNIGTTFSKPFTGAGNSTTSLSNYNDIPAAWK